MSMFDTNIVEIPTDGIKSGVNIKNIRTWFDRQSIEELAESIKRDGLMVPIVVIPTEDEHGNDIHELVAGERRFRSIQSLQREDPDFMEDGIPCIVFAGTIHDAKYLNAIENIEREDVDDVDVSAWIFSRVEDGVTQTEIAQRLSKSGSWVSQRVTFHDRAADEVKQALREKLIGFMAAYELAKNLSPEEQAKWIEKARRHNEKITVEDAKNAADKDKEKKPGKKARMALLRRAEKCIDDKGSEAARGMADSLRFVEGLISADEMDEIISFEEQK
jgi:ParB family chromosome partitioning protein